MKSPVIIRDRFRAGRSTRIVWALSTFQLLLPALLLVAGRGAFAEPVTRDQFAHRPGGAGTNVPAPLALEIAANEFAETLTNQIRRISQPAPRNQAEEHPNLVLGITLVVAGILVIGKLLPKAASFINNRYDPWASASTSTPDVAAEQQSFSEFVDAFTAGPRPAAPPPPAAVQAEAPIARVEVQTSFWSASPEAHLRELFVERSSRSLATSRRLFSEIGRAPNEATRQRILAELRDQAAALKIMAEPARVRPVWQMACALEGLLNQLATRSQNVNPSTLRTVAGGIDLLHALCARKLDPCLVSNPPIRLLVVDDDPISRHAAAFSLTKVFHLPELASNGGAALKLAEETAFDLVFLDIQMPGMDGFEVCSRIHGTTLNSTTPVVFVTCRSDFEARAQSSVIGGQDLIGKPFLTFELTAKALTLVLRRRLEGKLPEADARISDPKSEPRNNDETPNSNHKANDQPRELEATVR